MAEVWFEAYYIWNDALLGICVPQMLPYVFQSMRKVPTVADISHERDLDEEQKIAQIHFGLEGIEPYYLSFREKSPGLYFFEIGERILCLLSDSAKHLETQGLVDEMPYLSSIPEKGREVDITPATINTIYWAEPVHHGTGFARRIDAKDN
ncbi:hypothetical protein HAX54_007992 [Datura stramonium]|uniref:Uncharacterized protein n=1 Tax=Datura stramonium TaxID=4076 RepID=A0ABS8TDF4_DATST|nr:hypothetical protein [Datura stramonium]